MGWFFFLPISSLTNRLTVGLDWRDATNDWVIPRDHIIRRDGLRTLTRWRRTTITADYVGTWQTDFLDSFASSFSFGEDYGLQAYPKISASYLISESDWFPEAFDVMKLRAATRGFRRLPDRLRSW